MIREDKVNSKKRVKGRKLFTKKGFEKAFRRKLEEI